MKDKQSQIAYSLSPMQQGMFYHALATPHTGVDIEQVICSLPELLNVPTLERAWNHVLARHEVLRTTFRQTDSGEPIQEIQSDVSLPIQIEDWRERPANEQEAAFDAWLSADRLRDFKLTQAPLMRVTLLRISNSEWQMVWTFHHLLLDATGIGIVMSDVLALYDAFCEGKATTLPPLPGAFRDHIQHLEKLDRAKAQVFWQQTMQDFSVPTAIPVFRHSECASNEICGSQQIQLSNTATAELNSLATTHELTLNTLIQATWALLLARYSGTNDVLFGAVRSGRRSSFHGAESVAGIFINTVPVRLQVTPDAQLLPWLKEVRNRWVAIRPFEHTSLSDIHGWSDVPRDTPLFDTLVNFQPRSAESMLREQGGNCFRRRMNIRNQPNYPVTLDACGGDLLQLSLLYDRRWLDDAAATRMLGHLRTLLESMVDGLESTLGQLPLVTEGEQELLASWNETHSPCSGNQCIHELFEEQAQRTPAAVAVADGQRQIRYEELNAQANRVAAHLRTLGVGPDVRVGVLMERSIELVVAELGILKAGGAYVPFDPASPDERLAFMIRDSGAALTLIQEKLGNRPIFSGLLGQRKGIEALLRSEPSEPSIAVPRAARHTSNSSSISYVIYTSGSTGTPKGVEIEHASVANLIAWHQRTYEVTPADRATLVANPAFDASVWELWPYLTAGASIHIPDSETVHRPAKLTSWLADRAITIAFVPTPLAEALFDESWPEQCALRALLTGGDKLHRPPPVTFPCPLINHYGPTEYSVVTTSKLIPPTTNGVVPIGRPIGNTKVYILDEQRQAVPIGVPGELCISGAGLARGYLNRPELTAEKFVGNSPRLYRTGDLARWLPNGDIEFLGRRDQQVKIRGHRIELEEIESVLARHESVREAAVVARTESGEAGLTAFVVAQNGSAPSTETLRQFAKSHLPEYMLPAAVMVMDALPLTTNGKLDRKALAACAPQFASQREFVAPRSESEKSLAAIWREVLGVERIGIHDNFFELGGHSLLAARVITRVAKVFQREVPLRELFDSPTIAAMTERIENAQRDGEFEGLSRTARNGDIPISFAQERLWFLEQLPLGTPFNNIPFAFQIEGPLNVPAMEMALGELIKRHEVLRTTFTKKNGRPVAHLEPVPTSPLSIIDLSALAPEVRESKLAQLTAEEAQLPFNLACDPPLRARLLCVGDSRFRLLLTTHHIACDGWSADILWRELSSFYEAAVNQQPLPKDTRDWSYADFADWQRRTLPGDALESRLAFWKQQLTNAPTALDLPTDSSRPPVQTYRGEVFEVSLPATISASLRKLCEREGVTLFMLLTATLQTVLHRYSGQTDILIGTPTAGRSRVETENLIGMFLNTLVLRGDLSGDPSFRELLQRVRQTALDAFAHQDMPFEKLTEAIQPTRDLSRSPLFQVMFILQNEPQRPLQLAGLKVAPIRVHSGTAKFDLTLSLEETEGGLTGYIEYNTDLFEEPTISRLAGHFQSALEGVVANPRQRISQISLQTERERQQLAKWNDTRIDVQGQKCIHELFAEQVARTPNAVALAFEDDELTYRELNERADRLAAELQGLGVAPEVRVGICVERSLEMLVGLLAILKAGGCYVPLDPTYPRERLAFMLEDSQAAVLLTQEWLEAKLKFATPGLQVLPIDSVRDPSESAPCESTVGSENLAYVIYTSGSTGKPKGVMVTHRNVVNFFAAMDRVLGTEPGVWLALTSISFDISVLELLWTLTRGYKIVIQPDEPHKSLTGSRSAAATRKIDFSLFYFASDAGMDDGDRYRLLMKGAEFADANGFTAVWTPERHFHPFGGIFPNPSVISAAVAMVTQRIQLRAGSIVLPLHNPVRVAEEWSVVDNLSKGRAAISIASGWHANDFAIAPGNYLRRKELMLENAELIRRLWRGETVSLSNNGNGTAEFQIFPQPIQRELPMWMTSSGNPETFQIAGEMGFNLLTHLSGQDVESLRTKIEIYRAARRKSGRDPQGGCVSLMLHTFVWNDAAAAREIVFEPLLNYLRTYRSLSETAHRLPPAHANGATQNHHHSPALNGSRSAEIEQMLRDATQRYFENCGLFGTPDSCVATIEKLKAIGVDDIACLIDFGIAADSVLASLKFLNELRQRVNANGASRAPRSPAAETNVRGRTVAENILRHNVTHLQCTPSLAGALVLLPESREAMRRLSKFLLGGEALPSDLARQLRRELPGELLNMYGPTETTIWSATHRVEQVLDTVPIGRPIANTEIHILDTQLQPTPVGVPGELLIGGEGVARGYLNRPELTAEKFIAHPFQPDSNSRLYRTGDLARWRADGTIEFLGRLDQQVKLRGHRIELGEIESVLRAHPVVRECAVVALQNSPSDMRLTGYIVPAPGKTADATELRRFLEPKLPDYMIPTTFVALGSLPLTPNGKLDRKALPAPEERRPGRESKFAAPRSEKEQAIANVWRELLRVEKIGLHDNFFDLGGHSLLVVQAQARLREALDVDVPVVRLFQYPTVSTLANFLGNGARPDPLKNVRERGRRQRDTLAQQRELEAAA